MKNNLLSFLKSELDYKSQFRGRAVKVVREATFLIIIVACMTDFPWHAVGQEQPQKAGSTFLSLLKEQQDLLGEVKQLKVKARELLADQKFAEAKAVIGTLWSVPVIETNQLTEKLFENLAEGQRRAESLRAAQLELISIHREKYGTAHPLFWAGYSMTGK